MLTQLKQLSNSGKTYQGFRRYFANTSWMFAEQILRMISGLLVGIWVARYLGPKQFGVFSYALAFASLFGSLAKLGLDGIVVRELLLFPNQRDHYLGTAFWLKLIGAMCMLGVMAVTVRLSSNDAITNLYIFIIASGTIFQSFEVVDFYFQSKVLSKFVSVCKLIQLLISTLLKLYLIFKGANLIAFVLVSLVDQATLALSLYFAYRYQRLGSFYQYFEMKIAKNLLKDSWPQIFGGLFLMLQARIDQVMLKEMIGDTELGYYSSAMKMIEVFGFIPVILTNSLFPAIVNAKNTSIDIYKGRLLSLYRLMMLLFLLVAIPAYIFGSQIIIFFYKADYTPAGQLFSLMAMRLFFANYGVVRGAYLMTENLMSYSMITMIIGALVNIVLNYYLIPSFHSIGAIWSSMASFFIATFLIDFLYYRTRWNVKLQIKSVFTFYNLRL